MNDWLSKVPLHWGKIVTLVGFAGMILWAWFRPKTYIYQGAPDNRKWRDLRIWATFALGAQILLYALFR